jgi:tetratricopeptide (TPR) repeat protein
VAAQPANGLFQSDLAAAYLARASRFGRSDDFARALAAAERASVEDPDRVEPYFTKALTLEGLHQPESAVLAWQEYLRRDSGSPWKTEAEQRLASLRGRPQGASNVSSSIVSGARL